MTTTEIIAAVNNGLTVNWKYPTYKVIKDNKDQYLIFCTINNSCIGLMWADNITLNGKESDFYIQSNL